MSPKLLFLIPLLPLGCALVNMLVGRLLPRRLVAGLAVAGVASSALLALKLWSLAGGEGTRVTLYTWFASGSFSVPVELLFDRLAAPMTLMVTAVATLIHLYAVGYMEKEPDAARFFALLNLFVFAMLLIVLADNLLLLFLGWEGVGFCSYALIGFWYSEEKNALAGRKAFLVTRAGDIFLLIALMWLFALTGSLSLSTVNAAAGSFAPAVVTALGLLVLLGACGKSAQLPLMTWLADAMAGPTPVSALIHAATMVTAGVYLLCRLFPLISLSPVAMAAVAGVGALTSLYAATCALAQREIKRVLAYSTMSQVGYMFLAVGAGSVAVAQFHLLVHAFFKALLFMTAGCIIHLAGEENDIFKMGGIWRLSRPVALLFIAGGVCLAGAPLTGGFFSKDAVLLAVFAHPEPFYRLLWGIGALTALLTSFYTFRLLYLALAGEPRNDAHPHLPGRLMVWPLVPLALLGLTGGLLNLPALIGGSEPLTHWYGVAAQHTVSHATEWLLWLLAAGLFAGGWVLAHWLYGRGFRPARESRLNLFLLHGWQADALVEKLCLVPFRAMTRYSFNGIDRSLIDGLLEEAGRTSLRISEGLRGLATGRVSTYLGAFAWGLFALLCWAAVKSLLHVGGGH